MNRAFRSRLGFALAAGTATIALAGGAQARPTSDEAAKIATPQDRAKAADQTVDQTGDADKSIVVRARKRDETIEDVPGSVTVISDEQREQLVLEDIADFARQTPSAILIASGPEYLNDLALRGQGGGRLGFSESTTGLYRDGVFIAGGGFGGRSLAQMDFFDMKSFEVYRGPQGALYGRDSVGGAINIISRKPEADLGFSGKIGFNSVDKLDLEAIANVPLSGHAAVRLGGFYSDQSGGYYTESTTGRIVDKELNWGVRGSIGVGIGTDTNARLLVEYSRNDAPGFTSLGQNLVLDPDPFVRTQLDSFDSVVITRTRMVGDFDHDFGSVTLSALLGFEHRKGDRYGADFDHYLGQRNPNIYLIDGQGEVFNRYSGELRLASNGTGPLTWLLGGDFLTYVSDVYSDRDGVLKPPNNTVALRRQLRRDQTQEVLSSYSAFALVSYEILPKVSLSAEARYQIDAKDFSFQRIDKDTATNDAIPLTLFHRRWGRFLPTVALNYKVSSDLSLYGRVATGYRPGGFNQTPSPAFFNQVPYDPEDITSAEVGVKTTFRPGAAVIRVQADGFYSWTRHSQQVTTVALTDPTFSLENAGNDRVWGGEFELFATTPLLGGNVSTTWGVSTSRGKFDDGASILFQGAVVDLSGQQTPRTRDYMITANVNYAHDLGSGLKMFGQVGVEQAAGGWDNATRSRLSENYAIWDTSAGISGKNWRLIGYVKNFTNKLYRIVEVSGNAYYNVPRTYGASLSLNF